MANSIEQWEQPKTTFHAHFDCFSGAAGDMMLAACLDAAGDKSAKLLQYVSRSLEQGMPELKGEFSLSTQQVWRGMGSIAACYVQVQSKYNHEAAPVPSRNNNSDKTDSDKTASAVAAQPPSNHEQVHDHDHGHSHGHSHDHGHSHSHSPGISSNTLEPHDRSHNHRQSSNEPDASSSNGPLRNLPQIRKMLQDAPLEYIPTWVKEHAIEAFTELAQAEAKTHGAASTDAVHFHEVGAVDSIVDTVGTLLALYALGVTSVSCSRLPLGEGTVWTDHGLLPVPAPATLRLMVDMPTCPGPKGTTGELVTPTAAALLRVMVRSSSKNAPIAGRPPAFTIRRIGIGAGTKDFEKHPNVLRLMLGDTIVESSENNNL